MTTPPLTAISRPPTSLSLRLEELLQQALRLVVLLVDVAEGGADVVEALGVVGLVAVAAGVEPLAEVLDLLARLLHLDEAEGGGGALEEVAEAGEFGEVGLDAGGWWWLELLGEGNALWCLLGGGGVGLQGLVHLFQCLLCLLEEAGYDVFTEVAVVGVVVHFEDLG